MIRRKLIAVAVSQACRRVGAAYQESQQRAAAQKAKP